jgi:hypothetical protein
MLKNESDYGRSALTKKKRYIHTKKLEKEVTNK